MSHLRAAAAIAVLLLVAACGGTDAATDVSDRAHSETPYLLLRADDWTLSDAATSEAAAIAGTIWILNYEHDAGAGRVISAALTLLEAAKADELASQVTFEDSDVKVEDQVVSVWMERSVKDDHLIATHLRWTADEDVAWLTVYEAEPSVALRLVQEVRRVSEAEWQAAAAPVLDNVEGAP